MANTCSTHAGNGGPCPVPPSSSTSCRCHCQKRDKRSGCAESSVAVREGRDSSAVTNASVLRPSPHKGNSQAASGWTRRVNGGRRDTPDDPATTPTTGTTCLSTHSRMLSVATCPHAHMGSAPLRRRSEEQARSESRTHTHTCVAAKARATAANETRAPSHRGIDAAARPVGRSHASGRMQLSPAGRPIRAVPRATGPEGRR